MKPVASLEADEARALRGLLFDVDDTLLNHGRLTRAAYSALWDLADAGMVLVAVTGRPSAWGEIMVRQWPIEGAVTENGAVILRQRGMTIERSERCNTDERRRRRVSLASLVERVREEVPEARLTDDIDGRVSDVTWDIGERCSLPPDRVDAIARVVIDAGARTTRSSVHIHATFDTDDKATGVMRLFAERGIDVGEARTHFAFIGDSANDGACFSAFRTTFGVANVATSVARLAVPPRYIATASMGDGFAEVAHALLRLWREKGQGAVLPV